MKFKDFSKIAGGTEISERGYYFSNSKCLTKNGLFKQWSTGGVSGGSCWDDGDGPDPHYATEGDEEPEFDELDELLEKVAPGITHLQYKNMYRNVVNKTDYSVNEYYGNYSNYAMHWVDIETLYDYLVERDLLCE